MMDDAAASMCVCCVSQVLCSSRWRPPTHHSPVPPSLSPAPWFQLASLLLLLPVMAPDPPTAFSIFSPNLLLLLLFSVSGRRPLLPFKQARQSGNQPLPPLAPVPPLLLLLRLSAEACSPSVLVSPEGDSGLHPAGGSSSCRLSPPWVKAPAGLVRKQKGRERRVLARTPRQPR